MVGVCIPHDIALKWMKLPIPILSRVINQSLNQIGLWTQHCNSSNVQKKDAMLAVVLLHHLLVLGPLTHPVQAERSTRPNDDIYQTYQTGCLVVQPIHHLVAVQEKHTHLCCLANLWRPKWNQRSTKSITGITGITGFLDATVCWAGVF